MLTNLKHVWDFRITFPELTENQFRVLALYSFGYDHRIISDLLGCSQNAVKMTFRKIKEKLDIDEIGSARAIFNTRVFTLLAIKIQ